MKILAEPKAGVTEAFVHVPVYDAAPVRPVATGEYEHVDYSNLADIIVWLAPETETPSAMRAPAVMPINPDKPSDDIQPAAVGEKIVFQNRASHPVSLYSVSDGNEFELAPIAAGATAEYVVRSEGLIEVLADPAKPPIAKIYAAPTRWVARARSGQTVTFREVPPGVYQAISWHPRLPGGSASVTADAGHVSRSTLVVGVNALPQVSSQ